MLRQHQTKFGFGTGNCFATCIACLLDLPVDEVPNFCEKDSWFEDFINWCAEKGIGVLYTKERGHQLNCFAIVTGKSPRWERMQSEHPDVAPEKFLHSCIVRLGGYGAKDEWVHDPHPEGGFVLDVRDYVILVPGQTLKANSFTP